MNILCLSTWFPFPPDNGSRQRAYHLVRALAQAHTVTVVAFRWNGSESSSCPPGPLSEVDVRPVEVDPYRYVGLPPVLKFVSPIPLAFWPSQAMRRATTALRALNGWDGVIALQFPVAQYALALDMPRALDIDTALSYQMRSRALTTTGTATRLRAYVSYMKAFAYESYVARHFDLVTVASDVEIPFLRSMLRGTRSRIATTPNGVDITHNIPGSGPRQCGLVYNGALSYSANYDAMYYFLQEIYPLIRREVPDITLTVTGSTRNVDLSSLALDGSVRLTGYVDDVRLPIAAASVCVVPLRQGAGTRLKILEAMALGTPVVTTSKGAEGLEVIHGQHCLIADAPEVFAAQTVALLRGADLRERLAISARKLVEAKYSWDQIGWKFVSLVEEAIANHKAMGGAPC